MYRIVFDTEKVRWIIQLCKWQLIWKTVAGVEFETIKEAEEFANRVGLGAAYRRQIPGMSSVVAGSGMPSPWVPPRADAYVMSSTQRLV